MGWSIGYGSNLERDIGYGVPAVCDHPDCNEEIDRGLSYVCGSDAYGGEHGCGLFFCSKHRTYSEKRSAEFCKRCYHGNKAYEPKQDILLWVYWKLNDESWKRWRDENPDKVKTMQEFVAKAPAQELEQVKQKVEKQWREDL